MLPFKLKAARCGVAHFLSQHPGGRDRQISEFEVSLVYRVSSRTARAVTQRNYVLKTNKKTNKPRLISSALCYTSIETIQPESR